MRRPHAGPLARFELNHKWVFAGSGPGYLQLGDWEGSDTDEDANKGEGLAGARNDRMKFGQVIFRLDV